MCKVMKYYQPNKNHNTILFIDLERCSWVIVAWQIQIEKVTLKKRKNSIYVR